MTHTLRTIFIITLILFSLSACSSGSNPGVFSSPNHVTVDAVNDRLFVTESPSEMFALTASTLEHLGVQPQISEDNNTAFYDLMPTVVSQFGVYATGTTSRLFIMGAQSNDSGATVFNRIRVLDFDGTNFTEASFSPLVISDGDDTTDETGSSFADLLVDQENGVVYITDATAGLLYALSTTDGLTVAGPVAIAGQPQGMALDEGRLYICNNSEVEEEQVINVINLSDDSTTGIDLDAPCQRIAVQSNDAGTVLMVRQSDEQKVLIRTVDTTTYAASTGIASASTAYATGELTSGAGITSAINDLVLARAADGLVSAYLAELDGSIQYVSFTSDLTSYSLETLFTSVSNLGDGDLLKHDNGIATTVFLVAETGALLVIEAGTTTVDVEN